LEAVGVGDLSGGPRGLRGPFAGGQRFGVAVLYGPPEPSSGGEGSSHARRIPAPSRGANQAAVDVGLMEQGVEQVSTHPEPRRRIPALPAYSHVARVA